MQDEPLSRSAGKKAVAEVMLVLDHRNSSVLPKRTPWAGAMYCVGITVGNTDMDPDTAAGS